MVTLKICLLKEGEICFAVTLNDMYLCTFFPCVNLESSPKWYEMDSALVLTPFDLDLANLSLNKNEVLTS